MDPIPGQIATRPEDALPGVPLLGPGGTPPADDRKLGRYAPPGEPAGWIYALNSIFNEMASSHGAGHGSPELYLAQMHIHEAQHLLEELERWGALPPAVCSPPAPAGGDWVEGEQALPGGGKGDHGH